MGETISELAFEVGHAPPSPLWGGNEGGGMSVQRARQLRKVMSAPEAKLWNGLRALRPLGHHFRRQVPLGRYILPTSAVIGRDWSLRSMGIRTLPMSVRHVMLCAMGSFAGRDIGFCG